MTNMNTLTMDTIPYPPQLALRLAMCDTTLEGYLIEAAHRGANLLLERD